MHRLPNATTAVALSLALAGGAGVAAAQPTLSDPTPPPPIAPIRPVVPKVELPPPAPASDAQPLATSTTEPTEAVRAQAKAKSELGKRHYELGEYKTAIAAYREAYLILPSPGVLFNLGQAYRLAGDCTAAASAYRGFLRADGTSPAGDLAREQLTAVDACARREDDRERVRRARDQRMRRYGLAIGAAGVVGLGLAVYFANEANNAEDEVERHTEMGGAWPDIAETDAYGHRANGLAIGLGIGGAVAVATGALVWAVHREDEPRENQLRLWASTKRDRVALGVSCRF